MISSFRECRIVTRARVAASAGPPPRCRVDCGTDNEQDEQSGDDPEQPEWEQPRVRPERAEHEILGQRVVVSEQRARAGVGVDLVVRKPDAAADERHPLRGGEDREIG